MATHPSEIKRFEEIGAKDAIAAELLSDIVGMLDELDRLALEDMRSILEVKLIEARARAKEIKESTRLRGREIGP